MTHANYSLTYEREPRPTLPEWAAATTFSTTSRFLQLRADSSEHHASAMISSRQSPGADTSLPEHSSYTQGAISVSTSSLHRWLKNFWAAWATVNGWTLLAFHHQVIYAVAWVAHRVALSLAIHGVGEELVGLVHCLSLNLYRLIYNNCQAGTGRFFPIVPVVLRSLPSFDFRDCQNRIRSSVLAIHFGASGGAIIGGARCLSWRSERAATTVCPASSCTKF